MQILVKQCCQTEHDIGGTAFPLALTARANVTKVPLSAKVMDPTCLTPFLMILSGRCAVYIYTGVLELADQIYSAFSLVITESNSV
jgi:hypothetical protein